MQVTLENAALIGSSANHESGRGLICGQSPFSDESTGFSSGTGSTMNETEKQECNQVSSLLFRH
jgi:hypothetical protein